MNDSHRIENIEALDRFARLLASRLKGGETIALRGPLGAGKTALARSVIRHLAGDPSLDVPSPTFTLVQTYRAAAGFGIWHVDLYRLDSPADCRELGLDEAFGTALTMIEWPERLGDDLPARRIDVTIAALADGARQIEVTDV